MRSITFVLGVLVALQAGAASAAGPVTIRDVKSASAVMSANGRAIVISATVDLPNGCWTHPRVSAPARPTADADGAVEIEIVADSTAGPAMACPMIYRPDVPATPLRWTAFPPDVKAVKLIGERTPFVAPIER